MAASLKNALMNLARAAGLNVEGDETNDDLMEALHYQLEARGRR